MEDMKLVDEKEVEEAVESNRYFGASASSDFRLGFRLGSSFAEQKLLPMMVEFAEWCHKNYEHLAMNLWKFKSPVYITTADKSFTTQQLLEQFLKTRQK